MFNKRAIRGNAEAKLLILTLEACRSLLFRPCTGHPLALAPSGELPGCLAARPFEPASQHLLPPLSSPSQIWQRLGYFKNLKAEARKARRPPPVVGVLGCMAERLKQRLLESDRLVDLVAGPDAYR